ncbi:hypothetical protein ACG3SL_14155 [Sphingomonas sp. CJ20]
MIVHLKYGSATLLRALRRWPAMPASTAAVAGVLALGGFGATIPGWWDVLRGTPLVGLLGLLVAGGAGLLAFHLACVAGERVAARTRGWRAPLVAALIPVAAIPGMGAGALAVPLVVAALLLLRPAPAGQRAVALAGAIGALAGLVAVALQSPLAGCFGSVTMLGSACFLIALRPMGAANDNPRVERTGGIWMLPDAAQYATQRAGTRGPSYGE